MNEQRRTAQIESVQRFDFEGASIGRQMHQHSAQKRDAGERQLADVSPTFEAMKRCIDVRPRIRDHLDAADVKLGFIAVPFARIGAGEIVGDHRSREARISDHAGFNPVTEVNQLHGSSVMRGRR
jgi:hypothetical protein